MPRRLTLAALLLIASTATAATKPFHIELEANPAAAFPFLARFGSVALHVYPGGVRAETFWLNGFSRNGSSSVTVENPIGRVYTDVPVAQIAAILHQIAALAPGVENAVPASAPVVAGTVHGIDARRHRLTYGPRAWIDLWTATSLPEAPQLRAIVMEFARGISPGTAAVLRSIPGTPVYVELNFSHYQKVVLLRLKQVSWSSAGENEALSVGRFYIKAPMLGSIWK